uniref:Uncharacterized protein n=1 Tax=Chrysotila carterae TaxID=13221 RepID=A0A7S4BXU7_CHRCT
MSPSQFVDSHADYRIFERLIPSRGPGTSSRRPTAEASATHARPTQRRLHPLEAQRSYLPLHSQRLKRNSANFWLCNLASGARLHPLTLLGLIKVISLRPRLVLSVVQAVEA